MSVESASARKRKRIVEHIYTGFTSANEAIVFGNTFESLIADKAGKQKFRQSIGAPDTKFVITEQWNGSTVLKTCFLELEDNNLALAISQIAAITVEQHNAVHGANVQIVKEVIREKPQPQFINVR